MIARLALTRTVEPRDGGVSTTYFSYSIVAAAGAGRPSLFPRAARPAQPLRRRIMADDDAAPEPSIPPDKS